MVGFVDVWVAVAVLAYCGSGGTVVVLVALKIDVEVKAYCKRGGKVILIEEGEVGVIQYSIFKQQKLLKFPEENLPEILKLTAWLDPIYYFVFGKNINTFCFG